MKHELDALHDTLDYLQRDPIHGAALGADHVAPLAVLWLAPAK